MTQYNAFKSKTKHNPNWLTNHLHNPFKLATGQPPFAPHPVASSYTKRSPIAYRFVKNWQERAKVAKATKRTKKWPDQKRQPLEFKEGDNVKVKIQPQQFKAFCKVSKRLIRHYRTMKDLFPILKKVGKVSYNLQLPAWAEDPSCLPCKSLESIK